MYLPIDSMISQKEVDSQECDPTKRFPGNNYASALYKRLTRSISDYVHNLDNYYDNLEDMDGTLSFKISRCANGIETKIEAAFSDGMDWTSEEARQEFMEAFEIGDKAKMTELRKNQVAI